MPLDKTKTDRYDKVDISEGYDAIVAGWGFTTKSGEYGNYSKFSLLANNWNVSITQGMIKN